MRINLTLDDKAEWVRRFNSRDATFFVPSKSPPNVGTNVRLDLVVGRGGPKVIFRGQIIARRMQGEPNLPMGFSVALGRDEREKINYLNGYVRGGLLNLREARRLPVRLPVTYGGMTGPIESFTRDINDEGVFVVAKQPLPEESELHLFIRFPSIPDPVSLTGVVAHTVVPEDEDIPGMGIRFTFKDAAEATNFHNSVDELEKAFLSGMLGDEYLV